MFNRFRLEVIAEDLEPLLDSSYDFSNEKSFPKLRVSRHSLLSFRTFFVTAAVVSAIVMSYVAQSWKMDRDSAEVMRALDLEVAPLYFGKKSINYFGRLVRRDIQVTCSAVADNGMTVDFSERTMCLNNAQLHANCIRVCDSSFSSCGGCDALATDRQNQLDTAISHCDYKSNFVCTLASTPEGGYDYVGLSQCCLGSLPTTAEACLCQFQQSASALCLLNGACSGSSTCQKSSLTCIGTSTSQPLPVCSVPGALSCSFSGSTEVDLSCGTAAGSQYYLNSATSQCVSSCPTGLVNTIASGVGTCTSCSGAGVTTCSSSGTPTSCGAVGSTQYYLSASACVTSCPSGTSGSLSGTTGTCPTCGTGVVLCSGPTAYKCGTVSGVEYYLEPTTSTCVPISGCLTGYTGILNTGGNYECTLNCPGTGVKTCSGTTAYACDSVGGVEYYLEPTTATCVTAANCLAGYTPLKNGGGNYECTLGCVGTGVATCSGSTAYSCGTVGTVQYYLEPTTSTCVTSANCLAGYTAILNGGGNHECTLNCVGTGVATCSGSTAYSCGKVGAVQYFLEPTTSTCVTSANCLPGYTAILNGGGNHECTLS